MRAKKLEPRTSEEETIWQIKTPGGKGEPVEVYKCYKTAEDELTCFEYKESPAHKEPNNTFDGGYVNQHVAEVLLKKWRTINKFKMSDEIDGVDETYVAFEMEFNFKP